MSRPHLSRRQTLTGAATVGLGLPILSACGSNGTAATDTRAADSGAPSSAPPTGAPGTKEPSPAASSSSAAPADGLVAAADVPVGSGVVLTAAQIVVTQPTKGEFKGFSAVCTHAGCIVANVTTTINCLCHGSSYDIATGAVTGGPAPAPLPPVAVKDVAGEVRQA